LPAILITIKVMRLLLISNSTNSGEPYLQHALPKIRDFIGNNPMLILFIPYAAVTIGYDEYAVMVNEKLKEINHSAIPVHLSDNPGEMVKEAEIIIVGGGNTFRLLQMLQKNNILETIRQKVLAGTPYIGWSAGANIACPAISTTNDMPVVQPDNFNALHLVSFQINPHYLDSNPAGHAGETRETRIKEFIELNPDVWVVGLREGTMLQIENQSIRFIGEKTARIFKKGETPRELGQNDDFLFLM
jgi:dipeptidase E